jgi:hypothetical protein
LAWCSVNGELVIDDQLHLSPLFTLALPSA